MKKKFKKDRNSHSVSIGQVGKILIYLKKINVKKFYLLEKLKNLIFLNLN